LSRRLRADACIALNSRRVEASFHPCRCIQFMHLFLLVNILSICPRWQDLAIICTGQKRPSSGIQLSLVAGALQTPSLLRGWSEIGREILTASWLLEWCHDRFVSAVSVVVQAEGQSGSGVRVLQASEVSRQASEQARSKCRKRYGGTPTCRLRGSGCKAFAGSTCNARGCGCGLLAEIQPDNVVGRSDGSSEWATDSHTSTRYHRYHRLPPGGSTRP
jgi:hypothetical protein